MRKILILLFFSCLLMSVQTKANITFSPDVGIERPTYIRTCSLVVLNPESYVVHECQCIIHPDVVFTFKKAFAYPDYGLCLYRSNYITGLRKSVINKFYTFSAMTIRHVNYYF